jgi:hypothetical protein
MDGETRDALKIQMFVARKGMPSLCITATIALRADASRQQRVVDHQAVLLTEGAAGVDVAIGEGEDVNQSLA